MFCSSLLSELLQPIILIYVQKSGNAKYMEFWKLLIIKFKRLVSVCSTSASVRVQVVTGCCLLIAARRKTFFPPLSCPHKYKAGVSARNTCKNSFFSFTLKFRKQNKVSQHKKSWPEGRNRIRFRNTIRTNLCLVSGV